MAYYNQLRYFMVGWMSGDGRQWGNFLFKTESGFPGPQLIKDSIGAQKPDAKKPIAIISLYEFNNEEEFNIWDKQHK